jgi:hypothetical protein
MKRVGHVSCIGGNAYWAVVGTSGGKKPSGKPRCRWEDNIEVDGMTWTIFIWLMIRSCTISNKFAGCIKCGDFLGKLVNC